MTGKRFGPYNSAGPVLLLIHAIYRIHTYNRRHRYLSHEKVHTFLVVVVLVVAAAAAAAVVVKLYF